MAKRTNKEQETAPEQGTTQEETAPEQGTTQEGTAQEGTAQEGTAPEQETAPEQGTTQEETAPEETAPEETAPEETAPEETAPEQEATALPNPCVYCGPSVKGVTRQYTTYQGGIPDALREFFQAHPEALGLVTSTGEFPAMRTRLETPGTKEAQLYKAVKAELSK